MPEFPSGPRSPEEARGSGRAKPGKWCGSQRPFLPPVGHSGVNGALGASPFLLTLPYFTADCSCGNCNEDELQAAGKVPGRPGKAAERGAAVHPER